MARKPQRLWPFLGFFIFAPLTIVPFQFRHLGPEVDVAPDSTTFTVHPDDPRLSEIFAYGLPVLGTVVFFVGRRSIAARSVAVGMIVAALLHGVVAINDRNLLVKITPDSVTAPESGFAIDSQPMTIRFADAVFEMRAEKTRRGHGQPYVMCRFTDGKTMNFDLRCAQDPAWELISKYQKAWRKRP